jgi:pimeloyl-ACP methyl ester carboxylesterase
MTTATAFTDEVTEAGGLRIQLVAGGSGDPLVLLHNEFGHAGILPYHDRLAEAFSVKIPFLPGFGASERTDWIFGFRDLVAACGFVLRDLDLLGSRVIGFGLGAWLAAELAAFNPTAFSRMVLVAPMGIRPREGEIRHFLIQSRREVVSECFFNPSGVPEFAGLYGHQDPTPEQREYWEANRETVARVAWKPHMFDLAMPAIASQIRTPTLVVHGREDAIVPVDCGVQYAELIQGARLQVIPECGHCPEIEKPEEFLGVALPFLGV